MTGAGSGIGRATAIELAKAGYALVLVGRREKPLMETGAMLGAALWSALACDLASSSSGERVVAHTLEHFGRLDVLVNNAAVAFSASIEGHDETMIRETFAVNTLAPASLIAAAWPVFAKQRSGVVVNISSMAAHDPFPGFFAYAASKAALEMLSRIAADEGKTRNVRSVAVVPGAVETKMLRAVRVSQGLPETGALKPENVARAICEWLAGKREAPEGRIMMPTLLSE